MSRRDRQRRIEHWQVIAAMLAVYDAIAVNLSYFLALWFRFDCMFSEIPRERYLEPFLKFAPIYAMICVAVFFVLRLYNSIWRFASYHELMRVATASVFCSILQVAGITILFGRMPLSYYIIGAFIQFLLVLGVRFSYRFILLERGKRDKNRTFHRVMLVGAGNAGQNILRDASGLRQQNLQFCCIIDDNPNKWGRYIEGIPVVGGREDILFNVQKYRIDKIFVAIPSASAEELRDILTSEGRIHQIIKDEMLEIKRKYADDRRTEIVAA